ncbi:MAG: hypothetical protein Q9164_001816 [Protoblastenia rupestris]
MDPSQPAQPSLNTAYSQPSNPAQSYSEHESSTTASASQQRSDPTYETRRDNDTERDAMPSSLGYGERDSRKDAGESVSTVTLQSAFQQHSEGLFLAMGQEVSNTEGEQMRAAGDGDIAKTQERKHGFGEQGDLASGLDRKKAEQADIKNSRSEGGGGGVDVGAAIGGGSGGFVGADNQKGSELGGGGQSDHTHV